MSANRIWITLYQDIYTCGQPIQGTVNVVCQSVTQGKSLKLKLKGYEETKWVELNQVHVSPEQPFTVPDHEVQKVEDVDCSDDSSDSDDEELAQKYVKKYEYIRKNNGNIYRVRRGQGSHRVMNQTSDLGQLTTGHHSFPFQFTSLKEWPGTFFQEEDKEKGKIKYTVSASYGSVSNKVEIFMQEFKAAESDKHECNANITSCCCMGKGKVNMVCHFLKDALYIGEEQTLQCNINTVSCQLVNTVVLRGDEGNQKTRSMTVFNKSYNGCSAGEQREFEEKFVVSFPQAKQANRPTCHGKKITSQYMLYITGSDDASCTCCCSDGISVGNDTHIYSRPTHLNAKSVQDPNFNPKVAPILNIALQTPNQKKIRPPPPPPPQQPAPTQINQVVPLPIQNNQPNNGMQQPVMNNQFQQPAGQQQGLVQNQNQQQNQMPQGQAQQNPQQQGQPQQNQQMQQNQQGQPQFQQQQPQQGQQYPQQNQPQPQQNLYSNQSNYNNQGTALQPPQPGQPQQQPQPQQNLYRTALQPPQPGQPQQPQQQPQPQQNLYRTALQPPQPGQPQQPQQQQNLYSNYSNYNNQGTALQPPQPGQPQQPQQGQQYPQQNQNPSDINQPQQQQNLYRTALQPPQPGQQQPQQQQQQQQTNQERPRRDFGAAGSNNAQGYN